MPRSRPTFARTAAIALLGIALLAILAANVKRYFFIGDDAYISFRYAKHLVEGQGLVWNPGERVEGYTNFLWVVLIAAGMRLGVSPEVTALVLGIAAGAGVLVLVFAHGARRYGITDPFTWVAPFALALSRSFTGWCTGGLETQLFALLVFGGYLAHLRERAQGSTRSFGSSLLLAAATLTRPEGALFTLVPGALLARDVARGRRGARALLTFALPWIAVVGAHVLARRAYYGDWVPNTFRAKVSGAWFGQGLSYLGLFHADYRFFWFLPLIVLAVVRRRDYETALFAGAWAAFTAYIVWIGGDRFEFRFIVHLAPMLYLLLADGLRVLSGLGLDASVASRRLAAGAGIGGATALLVATHLGSIHPEAEKTREGIAALPIIGGYAQSRLEQGKFLRRQVDQGRLPPDLRLAVAGAGALPYYAELPTVDYLGLNDAYVARLPIRHHGVVGHEKRAPPAYLASRHVAVFDVLNRLVYAGPPEAAMATATEKLRHLDPKGEYLRPACVKVEDRYLVFGTTLSDDELKRRLGPLEGCGTR